MRPFVCQLRESSTRMTNTLAFAPQSNQETKRLSPLLGLFGIFYLLNNLHLCDHISGEVLEDDICLVFLEMLVLELRLPEHSLRRRTLVVHKLVEALEIRVWDMIAIHHWDNLRFKPAAVGLRVWGLVHHFR